MNFQCCVWLLLTVQCLWLRTVNGIKCIYHENSATTLKSKTVNRTDSYFGYATTYDNSRKSLVISSPREDDLGKIYDCNIKLAECKQIALSYKPIREENKYTHDYWLGATVGAGNGFVMACAPLTVQKKIAGSASFINSGTCFVRFDQKEKFEPQQKVNIADRLADLLDPSARLGNTKPELLMDSFGWSMDISDNTAVVGGPAMYKGRVMAYGTMLKGGSNSVQMMKRENNTNLPEFNLGYSVVSGKFRQSSVSKYYAVGSTYGREGSGSVHFFTFESEFKVVRENDTTAELERPPHSVGSMYGAALCAPKLKGLLNDILVGAPAYSEKGYSRGAVHVYLASTNDDQFPQYYRTIYGQSDGGRFGSTIISVGDLNVDYRDEIAIAAPFENDGRGVVYLYSGDEIARGRPDVAPKILQKIESPGYKSFGMSLTPLNIAGNGCNELAVGAPYNDTVVVYKCLTSINIEVNVAFPELRNRKHGKTKFTFSVDLKAKFPPGFPDDSETRIQTRVQLKHPNATLANPNNGTDYVFDKYVAKSRHPVEYIDFILPQDGNYGVNINCTVTAKLVDEPKCDQNTKAFVLLTPQSVLRVEKSVWATECSSDCMPDTTLKFTSRPKDRYRVGSSDIEALEFEVFNTGDVAYEACVLVRVRGAHVRRTLPHCEPLPGDANGDALQCAPTIPLRTNSSWLSGPIELYMGELTNKNDTIIITALLYNNCSSNNSVPYQIPITLDNRPHSVTLKGVSNNGESVTISRSQLKDEGKVIEHKYTITNNATTRWLDIECVFILEKQPYITYYDTMIYTEATQSKKTIGLNCTEITVHETEIRRTCIITQLNRKYPTHLTLPMKLQTDAMNEDSFNVTSKLMLQLTDKNVISHSVVTDVNLEGTVPIWIIILAILIGLILLFIIGFILYECGCLNRDKKKKLQALRRSVRRQTIIRQSMRQSSMQRSLLEEPDENGQTEINVVEIIENHGDVDNNGCEAASKETGKKSN